MRAQHADQGPQYSGQLVGPWRRRVDIHVDLAPDPFGHAFEQFFLAPEVPVKRHRGDAEVLGELADGQRVEPLGVGELERAVGDGALAEPGPAPILAVRLFWPRFCIHVLDNYTPYKKCCTTYLYSV